MSMPVKTLGFRTRTSRFHGFLLDKIIYSSSSLVCLGKRRPDTLLFLTSPASKSRRSEKYSFMKVMKPFTGPVHPDATLINYNGKLASVRVCGENSSFEMWVLDDLEKKQWSRHFYKLPQIWGYVYCAGVTRSNEVVLVKATSYIPFYVFYYSLETGTSRIVDIHGIGGLSKLRVYTFVDHVEDVKPLKDVLGL